MTQPRRCTKTVCVYAFVCVHVCVFESFDCSYMLDCTGFWAGNLFTWSSKTSPLISLSLPPFCSLCLFVILFSFFFFPSFAQCISCMPQLWWNSVDVIFIALLETSISSQTGLGWLGERIKSWIARPKRFQFETGDPASHLSHWGTFNWMHLIQFSSIPGRKKESSVERQLRIWNKSLWRAWKHMDFYQWKPLWWMCLEVSGLFHIDFMDNEQTTHSNPSRRWIKLATKSKSAEQWLRALKT